ncbi:glycosyltransferase family 2 protein, partial [Campylobacter volucris]
MSQVSIILPTYNVEKYIAKEYASKDERIKIIHNKENLKSSL